jgi:hypothetical protein
VEPVRQVRGQRGADQAAGADLAAAPGDGPQAQEGQEQAMTSSDDEQTVAEGMYRYFNREWRNKIQAALRQRSDTAQNTIASLLADAYVCGVRDGSFGMRTIAREMRAGDDQA